MPGFTAIAETPADTATDAVTGDGWWPDLSLAAFKQAVRLPGSVTDHRARAAMVGGMLSAQSELDGWRAAREAAGATSLDAVEPDRQLDGKSRAVILYTRAVHAYAAADLAETHDDISATATGRTRNQERAAGAGDLLRTATLAIRDLLGKRRSKVALL